MPHLRSMDVYSDVLLILEKTGARGNSKFNEAKMKRKKLDRCGQCSDTRLPTDLVASV